MQAISAQTKGSVTNNIAANIIPAITGFFDVFGVITDALSLFDEDEADPTLEMFNQIMAKLDEIQRQMNARFD